MCWHHWPSPNCSVGIAVWGTSARNRLLLLSWVIRSNKQTFLLLLSKTFHVFYQHPQNYGRLTSKPTSRVKCQTLLFSTFISWNSSTRKISSHFITSVVSLRGSPYRERRINVYLSISVLAVRMSYGVNNPKL